MDKLWVQFGADREPYSGDLDRIEEVSRRAALAGLRLQHYPIRHLGTERSGDILGAMYLELVSRGVEVRTRTEVAHILTKNGQVTGVETAKGETLTAPYVIVAPGREGADWLTQLARDLALNLSINPVDIGVRVELPAHILQSLTDLLYEPKFLYFSKSFDDRVRTFCVCPYGEVVTEWAGDVMTVNGHSYAQKRTENTNFAVLVSKNFTEPFNEPIAYGKHIARLANLLSGGIMVQRLGDLRAGRRTTDQRLSRCITRPTLREATPGDLNLVLPHRYIVNLLEMLDALDQVAPGVALRHTLLYGVEAKFYSSRLELTRRPGNTGEQPLCRRRRRGCNARAWSRLRPRGSSPPARFSAGCRSHAHSSEPGGNRPMPFRFQKLEIPEILLIEARIFDDDRGYFLESYKHSDFAANGVTQAFVQDNISHSTRGVLRGLHFQNHPQAQGKLVTVLQGRIFDVAVDIRRGSPTYGQWVGVELAAEDFRMLWVPVGFAHGFCVLSHEATVAYKVTEEYAPELDRGILWNDPDIGIRWPIANPILSQKDAQLPLLRESDHNFEMA